MSATADPSASPPSRARGTSSRLTLPVFLVYQLGVVFLHVRNATDLVTAQLLELVARRPG